ncbi:MAG: hypothetical protein LBS96_03770 [Oscillospiraceae bacterium]|jgi:hypothetical protein|nr:hypothetical protein [Oscillospiraceae bacterium]
MKKQLCALLGAAILLLAACGKDAPATLATEKTTQTTATTTMTITELPTEATTQPAQPAKIKLKTRFGRATVTLLDLAAPENADADAWFTHFLEDKWHVEQDMQLDRDWCVVEKEVDDYMQRLYLYNQKTGEEKFLLAGNETYGENGTAPYFWSWIDDTRFLYGMNGWEWTAGCGVFDVQFMKNMPLQYAEATPLLVYDQYLYSVNSYYDWFDGQLTLLKTNLRFLQEGRTSDAPEDTIDLLAKIPESTVWGMVAYDISPAGRYFAVVAQDCVLIFDLAKQTLLDVYAIEENGGSYTAPTWIKFDTKNTLYCFSISAGDAGFCVITLP